MVSTNLFILFYVGGIQNSNYRRLEIMIKYIFLHVGEISKADKYICSSTVIPLPVKDRHQRMYVEVRFYPHHSR